MRVSLTRVDELYGIVRIVHNFSQTLQISEEQVSTLVRSKATTKTNQQSVRINLVQQGYNARGVTLVLQPSLTIGLAHVIYQLVLQLHASLPDFLIGHIIDGLPILWIGLVEPVVLIKMGTVELFPLRSTPCGEVYAVGHVAHVHFFGEVTLPDGSKHLLRHLAMQPAYAINLLGRVASEDRHAEAFALIARVVAAQIHEVVPADAHTLRITAHVLAEEAFVEVVVTGRHGSMHSVQRRGTHQLDGLVVGQSFSHIVADALHVDEGCMSLVAVINVLLDTQLLQRQDTADTQQDFLLQTVLPVATIQLVGDAAVELAVQVIVRIQQIERHAAHIDTPYVGMHIVIQVRNVDDDLLAILIQHAVDGQLTEVLSLIVGNLLTVHGQSLREIAVTVEEAHATHVDVAVRSLFQVVAGQYAQTTGIYFEHMRQAILHAEVGYRRTLLVGLHIHIVAELGVDSIQTAQDDFIIG